MPVTKKRTTARTKGAKVPAKNRASKKHPLHKRIHLKLKHHLLHNKGFIRKNNKFAILAIVGFAAIGTAFVVFSKAAVPATKGSYAIGSCSRTDAECYYWSKQGYVAQVYKGLYGNSVTVPDKSGLEYWVSIWGSTNTPSNMAVHILNSIPAGDAAGSTMKTNTKEQFVDELYRRYSGREPDSGGKTFWLGQLGDGSIQKRAETMISFANFDEPRLKWQSTFRDGINNYYPVSAPAPTTTATPAPAPAVPSAAAPAPTATPNPQAGATAQYFAVTCNGNTDCMYASREGIVVRSYYVINGAFDQVGFKYWIGRYASKLGDTPEAAVRAMIESSPSASGQSADQFVTGLYVKLLERQPDSSGKAYWMGRLGSNTTTDKARLALEFTNQSDVKNKSNYQNKNKTFATVVADNIHGAYADQATSQEIAKADGAIEATKAEAARQAELTIARFVALASSPRNGGSGGTTRQASYSVTAEEAAQAYGCNATLGWYPDYRGGCARVGASCRRSSGAAGAIGSNGQCNINGAISGPNGCSSIRSCEGRTARTEPVLTSGVCRITLGSYIQSINRFGTRTTGPTRPTGGSSGTQITSAQCMTARGALERP